ncbi:hypothetical protein Q1695_011789 [Nippostrongylus brasiliensis]|nr:hypothetical protein Q1695_011789 [Nippostrongylus brasiliensis]
MGDRACPVLYVNEARVREALHIPPNLSRWEICSDEVTLNYEIQYRDMAPFVRKIVGANVRVLLYYGDTDMTCNFMVGQQFSNELGLKRILGKAPWKFGRQIAGFKTTFDGLTFITVKGAGHLAAQWRAPQMQYAIGQFLLNRPI